MENRAHAFLAVTFVLLFLAGGSYLVYWMESAKSEDRIYHLISEYEVSGLHAQSEVTYKGLLVGHVKAVEFHPDDPDKVLVRIGVQPKVPITQSMYAELGSHGITGKSYVALAKDPNATDEPLPTSPESPARIRMRRSTTQELMSSATDIADRIETLTRQLIQLVKDGNRERVHRILVGLEHVVDRFEQLEGNLQPSVRALPGLLEEAEATLGDSRRVLKDARRLVATAEEQTVKAGEAATAVRELSQASEGLVRKARYRLAPSLDLVAERLGRTAQSLRSLSERLEAQPQSILFGPSPGPPGPGEPGFEKR